MKVNEVVVEAPMGTGAISRFMSRFGKKTKGYVAQEAIKQWAQYANRIEDAGTDLTAENYEKELNAWLGKWFGLGRPFPGKLPELNNARTSSKIVNDYIGKAIAQFETGKITPPEDPKLSAASKNGDPETDVSKIVEPGMQFRFPHPEFPGSHIIVRQGKWFVDNLPKNLRGQINRDPETKLYPVLLPANIKKYNKFYNDAADLGNVKEEPAVAL